MRATARADELSAKVLSESPSAENRRLHARALAASGKLQQALTALLSPGAGAAEAEDRETEAALQVAIQRPDAALAALEAALTLQPDRISAKLRKAKLLLYIKRYPEFVEFTKTFKPTDIAPIFAVDIGDALIDAGERDRAAAFYQAAASLPDASLRLAALAWLRGDKATALRYARAPGEVNILTAPASLRPAWEQCSNAIKQIENAAKSR
ncbi:hypothetical protein BH18VER2_BH18VER2_13480 [soil metagenome]